MFYGSLNQFATCLFECGFKPGEFFAVSAWLTKEPMLFNHLGFEIASLKQIASREMPFYAPVDQNETERNRIVRNWHARIFTRPALSGQPNQYRLSNLLKDFALTRFTQTDPGFAELFSGIIYPSVAMNQLADNIAILPSEVDQKLVLIEVILLTMEDTKETKTSDGGTKWEYPIRTYDYARPRANGILVWNQKSQIVYPNGVDASQFKLYALPPEEQ